MASTYSTEKPSRDPARIPGLLVLAALATAAIGAIPTGLIGGRDAVSMMGLGAGTGLAVVVGGWWFSQLAFRGPDVYAVKLVVGGFLVRFVLLGATLATLILATDLPPGRFVLWVMVFYFVLVMVEAWILARENATVSTEGTR